jgi:myo-inositol-1(or 4)-monophosphatase
VRDFERVACAAAVRAGALVRARFGGRQEVGFKGEVDLVTAVDREAERLIVDAIRAAFPDHGIQAEESPPQTGASAYRWVIDPLDGTTNFAHGFPHVAVSVALVHDDASAVGVVHDPLREETFVAVRGAGARLNGAAVRVSPTTDIGQALLATGFGADRRRRPGFYLAFLHEALTRAQCVRRAGSAALDLCYVACGRLDGFWEWNLQPWDTAAGRLVVEEAGGLVSDADGSPHRLAGKAIVASNGGVHEALLALLAAGRTRVPPE